MLSVQRSNNSLRDNSDRKKWDYYEEEEHETDSGMMSGS